MNIYVGDASKQTKHGQQGESASDMKTNSGNGDRKADRGAVGLAVVGTGLRGVRGRARDEEEWVAKNVGTG